MGAREDETGQARSSTPVLAAQWAKKLSSVGSFAGTLARLTFWSSVCLRLRPWAVPRAQRQWHSPGQQLPTPQSLHCCQPVGAQRCPPTCSESRAAAQSLQDREVMKKKLLITGHKHLQYSCLGATELQPNGWNPKYSTQARVGFLKHKLIGTHQKFLSWQM